MFKVSRPFSRRKFLLTAGATTLSSLLLKSCAKKPNTTLENPQIPAVNINSLQTPETSKVKLGYIPIIEAAPLIIAKEKGLFAKYGMTQVELFKQASGSAIRDSTEIGSAEGGVDGGQYQMPIPHLMSEGKITKDNKKIPMYNLLHLMTHGNAIAIAAKHEDRNIGLTLAKAIEYIIELQITGTPFKAAFTFPHTNQDFWLRYWLAASGIDPDNNVELVGVSSVQAPNNMKNGTIDAFCTGEPWPSKIVADKIGFIAVLTGEIWKEHPQEYLAMRKDWVDKNPKATKALLKAIIEAQQWCDRFDNRQELSEILSKQNYLNIPSKILVDPYKGRIDMGSDRGIIDDKTMAPLYWKGEKGSISYPYKSHELWFLTESIRWGFLAENSLGDRQKIVDAVNREDLWKEAAKEAGIADIDIPLNTSRGVERFFDGIQFDPEDPDAYLNSLRIKAV